MTWLIYRIFCIWKFSPSHFFRDKFDYFFFKKNTKMKLFEDGSLVKAHQRRVEELSFPPILQVTYRAAHQTKFAVFWEGWVLHLRAAS